MFVLRLRNPPPHAAQAQRVWPPPAWAFAISGPSARNSLLGLVRNPNTNKIGIETQLLKTFMSACGAMGIIAVWRSGNGVGHINKVKQAYTLSPVSIAIGDHIWRVNTIPIFIQATQAHSAYA